MENFGKHPETVPHNSSSAEEEGDTLLFLSMECPDFKLMFCFILRR
jgi:hypothetical protein